MQLINIGFGNYVMAERILAVAGPDSAPVKRIIQDGKDRGMCIDATYGKKTRAVLITDSDHIVLSSLQPETLAARISGTNPESEKV